MKYEYQLIHEDQYETAIYETLVVRLYQKIYFNVNERFKGLMRYT